MAMIVTNVTLANPYRLDRWDVSQDGCPREGTGMMTYDGVDADA